MLLSAAHTMDRAMICAGAKHCGHAGGCAPNTVGRSPEGCVLLPAASHAWPGLRHHLPGRPGEAPAENAAEEQILRRQVLFCVLPICFALQLHEIQNVVHAVEPQFWTPLSC